MLTSVILNTTYVSIWIGLSGTVSVAPSSRLPLAVSASPADLALHLQVILYNKRVPLPLCCCYWSREQPADSGAPAGGSWRSTSECRAGFDCAALQCAALSGLPHCRFEYPITLTMWHMFFSGALAFICVRGGYVPSINMSTETYMKAIVPIGALFAGASVQRALLTQADSHLLHW